MHQWGILRASIGANQQDVHVALISKSPNNIDLSQIAEQAVTNIKNDSRLFMPRMYNQSAR